MPVRLRAVMGLDTPNAVPTWLMTLARLSATRAQSISGATTKAMILLRSCVVTRSWCYVMEETTRGAAAKRVTTGDY